MQMRDEVFYQLACRQPTGGQEAAITFALPNKARVLLKVMDRLDTEVRILVNEVLPAGDCTIGFLYGQLAAGTYSIKLIVQTDDVIDMTSIFIQLH